MVLFYLTKWFNDYAVNNIDCDESSKWVNENNCFLKFNCLDHQKKMQQEEIEILLVSTDIID